jgi:hypothetical protein
VPGAGIMFDPKDDRYRSARQFWLSCVLSASIIFWLFFCAVVIVFLAIWLEKGCVTLTC